MSGDRPLACYWMGPIDSLIHRLTQLMNNNPEPQLEPMIDHLRKLRGNLDESAPSQATGKQVKVLAKHVREMVYDIEDWIDLRQEVASFSESDTKQIDEFNDQMQDALGRFERYNLKAPTPHPGDVSVVGPGLIRAEKSIKDSTTELLDHPYLEKNQEVKSFNDTKAELLNLLDLEKKEELKVVSILGEGGCGKTTLAKKIYGDIKAQFDCQAIVSVGRTTSPSTAVIEILRQVNPEADTDQDWGGDEQQVITQLWEFLRSKRYFICIDDIRCTQASKVLNCALPDNNLGSRILITTRMEDIATSCSRCPSDFVYEMLPLAEEDSISLFSKSLYVQKEEWPDGFRKTSEKIVQVCGGVPLAIIIASGLLGWASPELSVKSNMLNSAILSELGPSYSTSQAMRKILEISYGDLPLPLRSCFLYLSAFSGNDRIKKDRLIRRWAAEGLIPESNGKSLWETGESYFNELISRRLIQEAFDDEDDQPIGCIIDGVVADFIESLSAEENFITAGLELKSGLFPCYRVRRVSLDCSDDEEEETISLHLSRVRALALYGEASRMPDISSFKLVRVLDLEDTKGLKNEQLESIGNLTLLRYLALRGKDVTQLPTEILALQHLATLDLRRTSVERLPQFRGTNMVSLLADKLRIWKGMMGMQKMEELSKVSLGQDGSLVDDVVTLVNEMRQPRMLGVRFTNLYDRQEVKRFLEVVGESNLQSLLLDNYPDALTDLLVDSWAQKRPQHMTKFELRITRGIRQVPQGIDSLTALTHLHINVEVVEAQGVRVLGKLPSLVLLKIYSDTGLRTSEDAATSSARLTVSSEDGFRCLKVLWYRFQHGGSTTLLRFEAGAMLQLQRLVLDFSVQETSYSHGSLDLGIQNLSSLVQVRATIDCKDASIASEVEGHIRDQVSQNPSCPLLEFKRRVQQQCSTVKPPQRVIPIHSLDEWTNQIVAANSSVPRKLVVIDFTDPSCIPSNRIAPFFADLANRFPSVVFLEVDIFEMDIIANQFNVQGIVPTFLFMWGGDEVGRVLGDNEEGLKELFEEFYSQMNL